MIKTGWKNKGGTSDRSPCKCGTWKQHWLNVTGKNWPGNCFLEGCNNSAEDGAHLWNPNVTGEYIAPFCKKCNNKETGTIFNLKDDTLASANRAENCKNPTKHIVEAISRKY